jgi:hypothetical protein
MGSEQRAQREEAVAAVEEATEQRMHSVAPLLPDPERAHEKASALSRRAAEHLQRAEELRESE